MANIPAGMWQKTDACANVKILSRDGAQVEVTPKRKKVALIGFATNTLHLVPWNDPEFELWGMNQGYMHCQRKCDRWFEMHSAEFTADVRDPEYVPWLTEQTDLPIYMIDVHDDYPTSVRYPIEDAIKFAGSRAKKDGAGDYFTSTIAFMLALAAMEEFEEVHLYGINLAIGDEYFYEKPCAEWWIGYLQGKGIKVYVPHQSSLLKQYLRYGYFVDARPNANLKVYLTSQAQVYRQQCEQQTAAVNFWHGRIQTCHEIDSALEKGEEIADVLNAQVQDAEKKRQEATNNFHIARGQWIECERMTQVAEGIEHGADLVLMPVQPTPADTAVAAATTQTT